jgi:hypothetical protein
MLFKGWGPKVKHWRDYDGKFAKAQRTNYLALFALFVIAFGTAVVAVNTPQKIVIAQQTEESKIEQKLEEVKEAILYDLHMCETPEWVEDKDGAIIFDSNEEASIGRFQFQRETVKFYIGLRDGREITNAQAIAIAIDEQKATKLASWILFDREYNGEAGYTSDWVNCSKKHDLERRVELVRELES